MRKITIDLNVILDFLGHRRGHCEAAVIYDLCATKRIKGLLCAHEVTTLSYFLFKELKDPDNVRMIITEILDTFSTIPVTETILRGALTSAITDFEDAVVEISSLKQNVDFIVTGNLSDFAECRVPAISPKQFLQELDD